MSRTKGKVLPSGHYVWPVKTHPDRVKPRESKTRFEYDKKEENLPKTVQGKTVGSKPEARVAVALGILKIPFDYQYSISGGWQSLPGSQRIDFLLQTIPNPTPLWVQGDYWHSSAYVRNDKDRLNQAKVTHDHPSWALPIEIWGHEVPDVQSAVAVLRAKLGRY